MKQRVIVNVAIVGAGLLVGAAFAYKPWQVYHDQRKKSDEATRQMQEAEAERTDLLRQKIESESTLGRERVAREKGYLKPGETVIKK